MDFISSQVSSLASQNIFLAYLIVYLAVIFIGNIAAFTSFWVAFQGGFGPFGVFFILLGIFCAAVSGDLLWYTMGRTLRATKFGGWIKRRLPGNGKLEAHIERHGRRWILISKFVYGSVPILFSVGWTKMEFRRFFQNSLLAIALWLPVILGVSYGLFSSLAPLGAAIRTVKDAELLFFAALLLFIVAQFFLIKIFNRLFGKNGDDSED